MKKIYLFSLVLMACTFSALSSDGLTINIQNGNNLISGKMADATILTRGRISYPYPHLGFKIVGNGIHTQSKNNSFILEGRRNRNNQLKVRVEYEKVGPPVFASEKMTLFTTSDNVNFKILIDGEQIVKSDTYNITISAEPILSD